MFVYFHYQFNATVFTVVPHMGDQRESETDVTHPVDRTIASHCVRSIRSVCMWVSLNWSNRYNLWLLEDDSLYLTCEQNRWFGQ